MHAYLVEPLHVLRAFGCVGELDERKPGRLDDGVHGGIGKEYYNCDV